MKPFRVGFLLFAVLTARVAVAQDICITNTSTFTVKVDLFAGELGYFYFEECGTKSNPTIGLEIDQVYTFVQSDRSNYFHPLGFAYFPDGAHMDQPELEPAVTQSAGNACAATSTCPAPMYSIGDMYLGTYSNIPSVANQTTGETDFGLDGYEPLFFRPLVEWASYGDYNVRLRFDDATYTRDLFYFCHIHEFMSGRIKLLQNGVPVNQVDDPPLGYEYDVPGSFDKQCGTFNLDNFQLPREECPAAFVCGADTQADFEMQEFSACIEATDCEMFVGMTTGVRANSPDALFIHQMIPHHQNAVNMAKAVLKDDILGCDDITNEDDPNCAMEVVLRSIVNSQNAQIQAMRGYLEVMGIPQTDDCAIDIESSVVPPVPSPVASPVAGPTTGGPVVDAPNPSTSASARTLVRSKLVLVLLSMML